MTLFNNWFEVVALGIPTALFILWLIHDWIREDDDGSA